MPDYRLGDDVDDYCIKCKRVTNHAIVSLMGEEPAKVRCRTCYNDHDFRRCEVPPSKKDLKKLQLFNEVLAAGGPPATPAEDAPDPEAVDVDIDMDVKSEAEAEGEEEAKPAKKGKKK